MRIFGFDLLPYPEHLDHLKTDGELPYPLARAHFRPELAVQAYGEHLDAWAAMENVGFDGVGFNEHHTSPYGLMTSPNIMAAAASQRLRRMQILIYGNLLPIHEPLRLAEELAMLDCLTGGRLIAGFARGIPREHRVYNVSLADSRARFEEAWEIIKRAWTEEVFSYEGKFWSYQDVAIWPRPVQQPHPRVWVPVTTSAETLEWAGRENVPITPGAVATLAARQDMVRYYGGCLARHGHVMTPDHVVVGANVYIADSREQALREAGPYMLYFFHTLFSHGNLAQVGAQRDRGYVREEGLGWLRPEHRDDFLATLQGFRRTTMQDLERNERLCWGTPAQVTETLIGLAEALGSNTLLIQFNQGAMPHAMFMNQIERFGAEVLPAIRRHTVARPLTA
jgi:alkanesulfonate monooxygenase SsuD/methylene tetrahydromethanopterin reductase-like flavin-dependent oxidoreductase (luciferase family)